MLSTTFWENYSFVFSFVYVTVQQFSNIQQLVLTYACPYAVPYKLLAERSCKYTHKNNSHKNQNNTSDHGVLSCVLGIKEAR